MNNIVTSYKMPTANNNRACWDAVIERYSNEVVGHCYKDEIIDMMYARDNFGREKYGMPLQPHNGQHSFGELYQELLDAMAYNEKLIMEGKDVDNILAGIQKILFVALENAYILYKQEFFCEHGCEKNCSEHCN